MQIWVGSSSDGATPFITKHMKHFPTIEVRAIGRKSLCLDAPVNFGMGLTFAVFQTWGITPCCRDLLNINVNRYGRVGAAASNSLPVGV